MKEKAKKYFEGNPKAAAVFFTPDGQSFFDKAKAESHAQRFKDGKVTAITRGSLSEPSSEDEKAAAQEQLLQLDLTAEKPDYNTMRKLVEALGVKTADQKAATLVAALAEEKEKALNG